MEHRIIKTEPVYEPELRELMTKLKAKGICLIVIGGERNKNPIEYSIYAEGRHVPSLSNSLMCVAKDLINSALKAAQQKAREN